MRTRQKETTQILKIVFETQRILPFVVVVATKDCFDFDCSFFSLHSFLYFAEMSNIVMTT